MTYEARKAAALERVDPYNVRCLCGHTAAMHNGDYGCRWATCACARLRPIEVSR